MIAPKKYLDRFPASMDPDRRMHAAMIAAVDDGVGLILDALKRKGLDRDTVIYFQADNGATIETRAGAQGRRYQGGSNAPFRGYKGGLFEGGIRVPALLSWPGVVPSGSVVDAPAQTADIMPTFLDWAGVAKPASDGIAIGSTAARSLPAAARDLFWEYQGQYAIRSGDWKLLLKPKIAHMEKTEAEKWLSNLKDDPGEMRNWLEQNPQVASELEARLLAWKRSMGL
jgi:arylsulfatase A-like enzyme